MSDRRIHKAARRADLDALRRELAKGVSPNASGQYGRTPLHCVCRRAGNTKARVACVPMLLQAGADVNAPDADQYIPLHFAARQSNAIVVAALLEAGADVNRGDAYGQTPLHLVWHSIEVGSALLLLRHGAAVNAQDDSGRTPLSNASYTDSESRRRLVPILLRAGAALPAHTTNAYIQKVIAAGGFGRYERNHLDALAATFAPHFAHLPPEIVRLVVKYAFHVGYY